MTSALANSRDYASIDERSMMQRVLVTSVIGTAIEWYDFFLYATASALVFAKLFFPTFDPIVGTIAAFGTFAVGYLSRPIGAIVFGHFGDRIGRKVSLVSTLLIMGIATFIIGLLPTYDTIGVWAPALLILMRFMQGFGVGGEWGGAVLMVVEYAPADKRGFFGSWPQFGVPLGLLMSTGVFALAANLPQDQFLSWGWRIPFLLSIVLIGIGLFIRLRITESPRFEAVKEKGVQAKAPLIELLRRHPKNLLLALGTRFATDITFNIINVFALAYGTQQLGLPRSMLLNGVLIGCAVELFTIPFFGWLSDRIGRRTVYLIGCGIVFVYGFLFFALLHTKQPEMIYLAYVGGLALSQASVYAVQSTWFAELFGTRVRYTGASLPYQIAGIITSGPAPLISTWLFSSFQAVWPIMAYIGITTVLSFVCAYYLAETYRRDLDAEPA
jgi:metabolite-proton symporter